MSLRNVILALIIIFFCGCKQDKQTLITWDVKRRDFAEKIIGTGTLLSANNNVISVPRISSSEMKVLELREEGIQVKPGDTVCILEANDVQKLYDEQYDGLQKLEADLVKMEVSNEVELSLLNAQLEEFKAQKSLSKLDSLQLLFTTKEKSEIKILEERINEIQQDKLIRKMKAQHMINEQSARALRSQIVQKKQTIQKYQDQLNQLVITSPAKGILLHGTQPVSVVMSSTGEISRSGGGKIVEGAKVRQNMRIVELPDLDSMQITLLLQEAEYKRVKTGQSVIIRPEAQPDLITTGTVKNKSLASKPLAYRYKVKSYKVTIDIDSLDNRFLPGLSANCELIVQSIKDTIVVPSISIFEEDSLKFVFVENEGNFIKNYIKTGTSNPSETIISEGLEGGETIALLKPPLNLIQENGKTENE